MAPPPNAPATSVQVAVRIRPVTTQDASSIPARFQRIVIHPTSETTVSVDASSSVPAAGPPTVAGPVAPSVAPSKKQNFTFDQVHSPSTAQYTMFTSTALPLISRFIEGFNCTILAYGQTSSGKTFTMTGVDLEADPSDPSNEMGIVPRAVSTIFTRARQLKEERGSAWNWNIKGSFIEIYNEDLIDLLSIDDAVGGRPPVQIREDKTGTIIWEGLREVHVKSTSEVMNLIRKGTAIRRTNETDMNAQSSRSHAIFSLTLTQKKFVGTGPPPRSSSPLPNAGRSPSRLARPGSMFTGNVTSPTPGRPQTPSFASAISRGGLRPASALGMRSHEPRESLEEEAGEWVTVTSKFHFVDLAGSERLKRTAAAGERIKEGISINSGLLALGNVISALGDPSRAKSHTNSHVPYRDSKLTRLLQDSLGGNAHTLMIACVSPAEWNVGETINTLKYANRARNIKNRAVVNEKEDGWDDVEWLQGTVTRLRKELKIIKEGGAGALIPHREPEVGEGTSKRLLAQMTGLQNNYEDLRGKFVERTEELTRLRRELGHRHRTSSGGAVGGTAKYEEIVGPVIEEYEKTIAAMEAELSLNRAALRMTNEIVEEKEEELSTVTERHAATELYLEELRTRVAKLAEREASTEAYVRDLEDKLKAYDESTLTSSESMTDLKREVARFKDSESYSVQYIADLEARLARSDESVVRLQQIVGRLETEVELRQGELVVLQTRLDNLTRDGESWRSDLQKRETRVSELEAKMEEWERKRREADEERARLGSLVGEVAQARKSLEAVNGLTPNGTDAMPSRASTPLSKADLALEAQLVALQQTHSATLADLANMTSKYRDALREISDLAAQIQEAKLNASPPPIPPSPSLEIPPVPPIRKRTLHRSASSGRELEPQFSAAGRRLFFKEAASMDCLHSRSQSQSQSLSQELSSVRSRKTSLSSHGTSSPVSPSPSRSNSSPRLHKQNISINVPMTPPSATAERSALSLEKEIMRLQEVLRDREAEISALEESMREMSKEHPQLSSPLQEPPINGSPIGDARVLPTTTRDVRPPVDHAVNGGSVSGSENDETLDRLNELMLSMAQKESQHHEVVDDLNGQLAQIRRQHEDLTVLSRDQAINMSNELETLRTQYHLTKLEAIQQHETELRQALETAQAEHASAIESMRAGHEEALRSKTVELESIIAKVKSEHDVVIADLRAELSGAVAALELLKQEHQETFGALKAEHEAELSARLQETQVLLERTKQEHKAAIEKMLAAHEEHLRQNDAEANAVLQRTEEDYYNALTKLRGDHAKALEVQATDASAALERLREEHASALRLVEIAREGSLSASESSRNIAIQVLQEEHSAAISRKEAAFAEEIERLKADHGRAIVTRAEDKALALDKLKSEYEGLVARLKEESRMEMERLKSSLRDHQEENKAATARLSLENDTALKTLKNEHALAMEEALRGHSTSVKELEATHAATLSQAKSESEQALAALSQMHAEELNALKETHVKALQDSMSKAESERSELSRSHASDVARLTSAHEAALLESSNKAEESRTLLFKSHSDELEQHRSALQSALQQAEAKAEELRTSLVESHAEQVMKLEAQHNAAISETESNLAASQAKHHEDVEALKVALEEQLTQEKAKHAASMAEMRESQTRERDALQKEHDLVARELEMQKAAVITLTATCKDLRSAHDKAIKEKLGAVEAMEGKLSSAATDRSKLVADLEQVRGELAKSLEEQSKLREGLSKQEMLSTKLRKHQAELANTQESLQRLQDEKDALQTERQKRESLIRELQLQLAHLSSYPDRALSFSRSSMLKLPPLSPPPSGPPPRAPPDREAGVSVSSLASSVVTSTSSRESPLDSPATSAGHGGPIVTNGHAAPDPKIIARLEEQTKQIEEQGIMIKTLNKQLTHCERDLQTHIDLSNTLEASLSDSEKNLRKARMQASELARERDNLLTQVESLRLELSRAQSEVATVRRSIAEEKHSLEARLDEERRAKERVRAQLDSRMEELQRRKSKFACL